jgi:hypothetical protein
MRSHVRIGSEAGFVIAQNLTLASSTKAVSSSSPSRLSRPILHLSAFKKPAYLPAGARLNAHSTFSTRSYCSQHHHHHSSQQRAQSGLTFVSCLSLDRWTSNAATSIDAGNRKRAYAQAATAKTSPSARAQSNSKATSSVFQEDAQHTPTSRSRPLPPSSQREGHQRELDPQQSSSTVDAASSPSSNLPFPLSDIVEDYPLQQFQFEAPEDEAVSQVIQTIVDTMADTSAKIIDGTAIAK